MSETITSINPQSASLLLSILQSKAGGRWGRALEELEGKRLQVDGDFPEFVVTNKSGVRYSVTLDPKGNGSCSCPDFQIRTSQEGRLCKHVAAAAITSLIPLIPSSQPNSTIRGKSVPETGANGEAEPYAFRLRTSIKNGAPNGLVVEVEGLLTGEEAKDHKAVTTAYGLLNRVAASVSSRTEPKAEAPASTVPSQARATTAPAKPPTRVQDNQPISAVISKVDRMKTRRGESFFLLVQVGADSVRVFGTPEELAEKLEESGYDIPAGEIQAGMELNLPCHVLLGAGANGYKTIEKFLPGSA